MRSRGGRPAGKHQGPSREGEQEVGENRGSDLGGLSRAGNVEAIRGGNPVTDRCFGLLRPGGQVRQASHTLSVKSAFAGDGELSKGDRGCAKGHRKQDRVSKVTRRGEIAKKAIPLVVNTAVGALRIPRLKCLARDKDPADGVSVQVKHSDNGTPALSVRNDKRIDAVFDRFAVLKRALEDGSDMLMAGRKDDNVRWSRGRAVRRTKRKTANLVWPHAQGKKATKMAHLPLKLGGVPGRGPVTLWKNKPHHVERTGVIRQFALGNRARRQFREVGGEKHGPGTASSRVRGRNQRQGWRHGRSRRRGRRG